jgi:hypothetical protein
MMNTHANVPNEVLTPAETAKLLKVNVQTVYDLCEIPIRIVDGVPVEMDPELGHYRIGRKILIPRAAIDAYLRKAYHPAAEVVSIDEHRLRSVKAA